jgi:hypothetical protein
MVGNVDLIERASEGLFLFYEMRSWFSEGAEAFAQAAACLSELHATSATQQIRRVWGKVLGRQGWCTFQVGRQAVGRALLEQSLAILRALEAPSELVFPLNYLASGAYYSGDYEQANQLAEQINSTQDDVSNARARLAADDEYRRTHTATIPEGEQAKIVLHRKLRQRITDAIGDRALFPAWFTTALGYSPPADSTAQWIAAATELIAYRITYAITDPAVALGPRPVPDQAIRAAWYNTLTTTLRDQRQWP